MDYGKFVQYHKITNADITIAVQPVEEELATGLGILKRNSEGEITNFHEKPEPNELKELESIPDSDKPYMASMGIYVFTTDLLVDLFKLAGNDSGKDIIPNALKNYHIMGYIFEGYWADIGTIRRFYEVNLEMTLHNRQFRLNIADNLYTHPRFLPPSEIHGAKLNQVLVADGCQIGDSKISNSVIGLRSRISDGTTIKDCVIMGADYKETPEMREENKKNDRPNVGIGQNSILESAIVDKNARIGTNVKIRNLKNRKDVDSDNWFAREGLVIVPKDAIIPDGSVI